MLRLLFIHYSYTSTYSSTFSLSLYLIFELRWVPRISILILIRKVRKFLFFYEIPMKCNLYFSLKEKKEKIRKGKRRRRKKLFSSADKFSSFSLLFFFLFGKFQSSFTLPLLHFFVFSRKRRKISSFFSLFFFFIQSRD